MSFWDYLFDNEYRQRDDINALKASIAADAGMSDHTRRSVGHLASMLKRQELLLEALVKYLTEKELIDPDGLSKAVTQLDLADGVEDGQIGPDRIADAPKCPFCDRPRNPNRDLCVYCGEEITAEDAKLIEKAPAPEYVRCHKCFRRVRKEHAVRTMRGDFCRGCSSAPR
jgi:hypothetical protein